MTDTKSYLDAAMRVSELYTRRIRDGVLPADKLDEWKAENWKPDW